MAAVPMTPGRTRTLVLTCLAVLSLALAGSAAVTAAPPPPPADLGAPPPADAAALAGRLSEAELVGQVLMPYVYGDHPTEVPPAVAQANQQYAGVDTPAELVDRYHLGGVILMRRTDDAGAVTADSNVASPEQVRTLTDGLQEAAGGDPPLLIGIDQEYGVVARLTDGVTGLPTAMAFGAAGEPALTEAAWRVAGTELAAVGVNLDFAPVADVLGGGPGGIIGSRSYGDDPAATSAQVAATVRGLQGTGVAATLKHFPGHGNTDVDSHTDLPVVPASHPLTEADLPPFTAGIDAGAWLVMSGHLDVRAVESGMPASFSKGTVTGLLRDQLGFDGVAVTDAMNMEPARRWPPGEAAVRALLAGNDLLLMPPDLAAAYDGLLAALDDGTLPRERLVQAATRVLALKLRIATGSSATPDLSALDTPAHHEAVAPAAAASITLLRGPCPTPAALVDGPVTVTAAAGRDRAREWLAEALAAAGAEVVESGGAVVHLVGYGDGPADLRRRAAVTVAMDTPHLLAESRSPVLLATYSSSRVSMEALAAVLAGRAPAPGRSPVDVPGLPRAACDA
jgi:beta-N-acetylhexosaminidase